MNTVEPPRTLIIRSTDRDQLRGLSIEARDAFVQRLLSARKMRGEQSPSPVPV